MDLQERYEGDFLEALDLPEGVLVKATIESIAMPDTEKDAAGKLIHKAIVKFANRKKRMILNKTNFRLLKVVFGPDVSKAIGGEVMLQRRYLPAERAFGHANELAVRFIPPDGTPLPKSVRDYMGYMTPQ
jgi:hypothetical protein